ncbi:MAG: hypothetical protein M3R61_04670 [Chloroflexota bacterium]|nr:hypothetical protein [Chloroflexota bacterium]
MRRIIRAVAPVLLGLVLILAVALLLNPSARQLAPSYLYYDLIGRRIAPAAPEIEQFVLQSGQDYCAVGRDSECGGWRLVAARVLPVDQAAQQRGTAAAWCVDYVMLRRNQSRATGGIIYWANIPSAMIVARASDGQLVSTNVANCRTAQLE